MARNADDPVVITRRYARFALAEARGAPPLYEHLALAVAGSAGLLTFLSSVPSDCRQPNLFLAAVRQVGGVPRDGGEMEEIVRAHAPRIREGVVVPKRHRRITRKGNRRIAIR